MIKLTTFFFFLIFAMYFITSVQASSYDYSATTANISAELSPESTNYYLALYSNEL